jgi:threonine synthase
MQRCATEHPANTKGSDTLNETAVGTTGEHEMTNGTLSSLTHLECSVCSTKFPASQPQNLCTCGGPLLARYDLERTRREWNRNSLNKTPRSMWRYAPVLPVQDRAFIISLGEGWTPLLSVPKTSRRLGIPHLFVKDDGINPTGSFKARGLSCAISRCAELGIRKVAVPSAGNAASASAAYAAAAGIEAHIFMPADVPQSNFIECQAYGARVTLVDGLISDCARIVAERAPIENWFEISTLKEPYRVEGKKTMGYELAEQLDWKLPDVILYPTGGGVGLIGMWKAFEEMEALGWIDSRRPRMIAVQAEGCQPIVRAFEQGAERSQFFTGAQTVASGLRVPKPLGDFLILDILRKSNGTAIAVSDRDLVDAGFELASEDGLFIAPEGAACVRALEKLIQSGVIGREAGREETVVIYNTGSGLKYLEAYSTRFQRMVAGDAGKLGGLITPR